MKGKKHFKTIVISDLHLGTKSSKAKEVIRFLKAFTCERLILNGDIIDGWRLKTNGKWKKSHTRFFKLIIRLMQKWNTEVIYLRGNHDDFLDEIAPITFGKLSIQKEYVLESQGRRFWVVHGDIFDSITTNMRWLAKLGDWGYNFLLWLNKIYNNRRNRKGLPYYSLSKEIKHKVKSAVSYISKFELELVALAKQKNFQGIICGHIHHPTIQEYGSITYMNSGDWVESLSALMEDEQGNWEIKYYQDLLDEEAKTDKKEQIALVS